MTIANTFAAKASVAFVAIAMALSMVAPAQAQTAEELQAQIDTLMATIAALQGGTTATASADAYVFTRALTIGSQGADVTALQNYLIGAGFSIPAGATGYFGAQTQAAVAAWQTANGVMPAAGYFGPISQAKYTALVAATPSTPSDEDEDEDEDDSDSVELSGEASLDGVESNDGDDTEIEEGQEAAPVAEFEVEFTDGDAQITRVDLSFVNQTNNEDPWEVFEEVSLWVDGDEVATKAADDEDDYLDEDDGSLRFTGLDIVGMEDEPVTIVVAVTVQSSVDNIPQDWTVDMDAIRFVDADDVTSTENVSTDAVDFTVDVEGGDDELAVKSSSEDPDATTLQLEDDGKSDWMTVFAFDLDTDDSSNDIEINEIPVTIDVTGDTFGDIVSDLQLVVDGEEFDDWSITTGANGSTTVVVTFDLDGDLVIEAGDRVTAELQVEFKQLAVEGSTIKGSVTGANADDIDAEGADDLDTTQLSGAASGDTHTLRSSGLAVDNVEDSASVTTVDGGTNDYATFTLEFDVTAFEQDVYISTNPATSTVWEVQDASGADLSGTGTSSATFDSTADEETGFYVVSEGETETFTLEVTYVPGATNTVARLQLLSIEFDEDADATPDQSWTATPASEYRTSTKTIVN